MPRTPLKVLEKCNEKVERVENSLQLTPDEKCQQSILLNHHLMLVERLMFDKGDIPRGVILGRMITLRTEARADGPWGLVGTMTSGGFIAAAAADTAAAAADTAAAAADDDDESTTCKKKKEKTRTSQAKQGSKRTLQRSGTRGTKPVLRAWYGKKTANTE